MDKQNLLTPNSLNTICQYFIHMCVLLNFLLQKKEKTLADITFIASFTTIANTHTQVEIELDIITLQFL